MTFEDFWTRYPRRDAKKDARKAWDRLSPDPALQLQIAAALDWQVTREEWLKDDGQYIPLPATWIRGERWTDERRIRERRVEQQRHGWNFDCPHTPLCTKAWDCMQKTKLERKAG